MRRDESREAAHRSCGRSPCNGRNTEESRTARREDR